MHVVHIIFSFHTGGAETMLVDILSRQHQLCKVSLIIINDEITGEVLDTLDSNVDLYCLRRKEGSRNPLPVIKLNTLLRKLRPDVVHMHNENAVRLLISAFGSKAKKVLTVHAINVPCVNMMRYHKIFAISEAVGKDLDSRCGVDAVVVPNGIPFHKMRKKKSPVPFSNPCRIVQIGRLVHEKKGQHLLIKALSLLPVEQRLKTTITFIGEGSSKAYLENLALTLGVEKSCIFAGLWHRAKIYDSLADFDVLVQPSLYEGFGLTVVEGIAAGLPVVVADGDGPAEILAEGKYGWLFRNGDSRSLANVLLSLIKQDHQQICKTVDRAFVYAEDKYDIARTSEKYLEVY